MKKSFKSLISILTVAVMLFAFAPAGMAAETSNPAIALYGTGASTTAADVDTLLSDDYFYMAKDVTATGAVVNDNLDKVVAFTQTGSGLEFTWAGEEVLVKRLDLWMLNCGGIGDYRVTASVNGVEKTVASGNLDKDDADPVAADAKATASYYPIVFEQGVTTANLKFIIDSFSEDGNKTAYISEAKVYDTNEINFGAQYYANNKSDGHYSPYLWDFGTGYTSNSDGYNLSGSKSSGKFWCFMSSTSPWRVNIKTKPNDDKIWYATGFNNSKVKVNQIGFTVASGSVKEFEVWVAKDNSSANIPTTFSAGKSSPTYPLDHATVSSRWEQLTTIKCDMATGTSPVFGIPNAVEANSYMVVFKDQATTGTAITQINMYSVADSEVPSTIYEEGISGTVAAGSKVTLNMKTNNLTNNNAKVYFALYSGTELKSVTPVACSLTGSDVYSVDYQIPADAGTGLSVKAFVWDGKTLKPLLNTPVLATE